MCNVIPGASLNLAGIRGTVDRPFAGPFDIVTVGIRSCGEAALDADVRNYAVTIVFTPPHDAPSHVVVLTNRRCDELAASLRACSAEANVNPLCVGAETSGEDQPLPLALVDKDDDARGLRFRFPDTRPLGGGYVLTGPVAIAVSHLDASPLPCGLARPERACQDAVSTVACIDELFEPGGGCAPRDPHHEFPNFVALPPRNDYQSLCSTEGTCAPTADRALQMAIDAEGNLLLPVDWSGVLVRLDGVPFPRLLRGGTSVEAFTGSGRSVRIPGKTFLGASNVPGRRNTTSYA